MDIRTFAREQWGQDERDPAAAANAYLKAALEGKDPYSALLGIVRGAMSDEFRSLRKGLTRQSLPWDAPGAPARHVFPAGETARHERLTLTDKRAILLREQVWTVTRGMILWAELTAEDITLTVAEYRRQINGVEETIERLDSARRVLERHQVDRLGEAPWDEIMGIVRT